LGLIAASLPLPIDGEGHPIAKAVQANAQDEFAIAGLPKADLRVRATIDGSMVEKPVPATAVSFVAPVLPVNLRFNHHSPQILTISALVKGEPVQFAEPGQTVNAAVKYNSPDGDPVHFEWRTIEGMGLLRPSGDTAEWTLPKQAGRYYIYVVGSDGKGGYTEGTLSMRVGDLGAKFSGKWRVIPENLLKVRRSELDGKTVLTGPEGTFSLRVPSGARHVMNIRKHGYALLSRVFDNEINGQVWRLIHAQLTTIDPGKEVEIVDQQQETSKARLGGARLRIPADSLVDSAGRKPVSPISASILTLDTSKGQAPGDWSGLKDGHQVDV
jgi:hypothetical protein